MMGLPRIPEHREDFETISNAHKLTSPSCAFRMLLPRNWSASDSVIEHFSTKEKQFVQTSKI